MFPVLFARLTGWLGGSLVALFGAWKSVLLVTAMGFIAIVAYNLIVDVVQESLNWALTKAGTIPVPEGHSSVFQFTGFVGWFMGVLKIPECMSFIISMVGLKFLLRKIPFLKW